MVVARPCGYPTQVRKRHKTLLIRQLLEPKWLSALAGAPPGMAMPQPPPLATVGVASLGPVILFLSANLLHLVRCVRFLIATSRMGCWRVSRPVETNSRPTRCVPPRGTNVRSQSPCNVSTDWKIFNHCNHVCLTHLFSQCFFVAFVTVHYICLHV